VFSRENLKPNHIQLQIKQDSFSQKATQKATQKALQTTFSDGFPDHEKNHSSEFDVYVLSTSPWENPTTSSDKFSWVKNISERHHVQTFDEY
jgi:hypothetical protein